MTPHPEDAAWLEAVRARLEPLGSVLVAVSGGVDSGLLLDLAAEALPGRVLAVTFVGPVFHPEEASAAAAMAAARGVPHQVVVAPLLEHEPFVENPDDRCYHCKRLLFGLALDEAARRGFGGVLEGTLASDLEGHRPGARAARELGVVQPFVDAGVTKEQVRRVARARGQAGWDAPPFACLASRFPPGTHITAQRLRAVARVEQALRELGFRQYRVRYHLVEGVPMARLEVDAGDLARLAAPEVREKVLTTCREEGFRWATMDLEGYRTGSVSRRP